MSTTARDAPARAAAGHRHAPLTQAQKKYLKGMAHNLKPVVSVGNKGLTGAVMEETRSALDHHELIKLKLPAGEKALRSEALKQICKDCKAERVTLIGRIGVIFKPASESRFSLPI